MTAAFPHSVSTGAYTIEQLEGEDCAVCGQWLGLCPWPRPIRHKLVDDHFQTFRHVECEPAGGVR